MLTIPPLFGAVAPWVTQWLTPIWLLGVGAVAGLLGLLLLWVVAFLLSRLPVIGNAHNAKGPSSIFKIVSKRNVDEVPLAVGEGVLLWIFYITAGMAVFGVVGSLLIRDRTEILKSLARLPYVGTENVVQTVAVSEPEDPNDEFSELEAHEIAVDLRAVELLTITFLSDQNLELSAVPFSEVKPGATLEVNADEELLWIKGAQSINPFIDEGDVPTLYVRNLGSAPAALQMTIVTAPPHPQISTVPVVAFSIITVFLLYFAQRAYSPRLSGIALATFKSETAQPLFWIIIILGVVALWFFIFIPYYTLGDDIKMLKDTGLTLIMVMGIAQAVWAAGTSVADEIDGKTALTVLSKPVGRRSFLIGKFLGIAWTVLLVFVILGLVLLLVVAYKPVYDAKESSETELTWQLCHLEMVYTVPGLALAFMEAIVLAALSVAIATRLPLIPNAVICATIYVLGHLPPLIVQSSMGQFVFVQFFGQLIATVFPNLDHFNIQAAIAAGAAVPMGYLMWSAVYCIIYTLIAMLLGLALFEDRDLA